MTPELRRIYINQIYSMMQNLRLEGMYSTQELDTMSDNQVEVVYQYLQDQEAKQ